MNAVEMLAILDDVRFYDYQFKVVEKDDLPSFLQATYVEPDIVTGKSEVQYTRKWQLSPHMTKSEFVQTVFKCCITSMEHRTREHFRYKGAAIFGPHFDIDALLELCHARRFDYREAA
jgi:hypothetical protein